MSTNGNGGWTYTNPPPVYTGALWLYKLSGTTIAKHTTDLAPGTGETGVEFNIRSWAEINSKLVYTVGPHAADHQVEGKYLFSANSTLTSTTRITLDTNEQAWDIKKNGGTVYVLTAMPNGSGGYTTRIRATTDGTNFPVYFEITTTSFGMSFDILNGEFYIAQGYDLYGNATSTETGRLYRVTL